MWPSYSATGWPNRVDADFVLTRLREEVNADAADLYDTADNLLPVRSWPKVWRRGLVSTIRTTKLCSRGAERGEEIGETTDIVLVDRAPAGAPWKTY